jgi:hypothetical protein
MTEKYRKKLIATNSLNLINVNPIINVLTIDNQTTNDCKSQQLYLK